MKDDLPHSVRETVSDISENSLEFIERQVFYALDDANKRQREGEDVHAEILAYEDALETITAVQNIKEELTEEQIEQAREIKQFLQDTE